MNENETRKKNQNPSSDAVSPASVRPETDSAVSSSDNETRYPTEVTMVDAPGRKASAPDAEWGRTELTMVDAPGRKDSAPDAGRNRTELTMVSAPVNPHQTDVTMIQENPPEPEQISSEDDLQPGDRIDRYTIVRKLGQGGMGSVYLVRHETLGVFRAAKVLSGALYKRGGEFVKRFIQEAKMACSISHPNIVNVLDVGDESDSGLCYIIMEYVDGGTVRNVLHTIPRLSEIHAVIIAEAVAEALKAVAEQKIVHRDIKPDNVMLTRRGEVKLADLGIAKSTDENVQLTKSHIMMGTPAYLAPEQAQDAHSVDVRADIYSLGATLYEMLTGEIPYPGKSTYDILTKLVSDPVPDPRALVDSISPQTARLVMKMLSKQAKQRQHSAAELLKEIHALNILPPNFDSQKSIRELLEQSGAGNYSTASLTPTTGNPVSTWLMRHVLLKLETSLRKIPVCARMIDAMHRDIRIFYAVLVLVTLLLIGLPITLVLTAPPAIPDAPFSAQAVQDIPDIPDTSRSSDGFGLGTPVPGESTSATTAQQAPKAPETMLPSVQKGQEKSAPAGSETAKSPADSARLDEEKRQREEEERQLERKRRELEAERRRAAQRRSVVAQTPKTPASGAKKIAVFAEITPVGANAVLKDDAGRELLSQRVPISGKIQFNVPAGQYRLFVSAPGFRSMERAFPVSDRRTITCVKVDLPHDVCTCTVRVYGSAKLLDFLKVKGVELRVDDGKWNKVTKFPYVMKLTRMTHTLSLQGTGIRPTVQTLKIAPDQAESTAEIYLTEKDASLEISTKIKDKISINLFGIWVPLKKNITLSPFKTYTLKWRISDGMESIVQIPELQPESVYKIVLERKRQAAVPGEEEFAEAEKLIENGDNKDAVEKLKAAAEKGHPEAMFRLGQMNEQGKGRWFSSDSDALACYQKAAEPPLNHAKAQYQMGLFYEKGRGGLDRDIRKAMEWYKKSADQKNPDALFRIGMAYKDGDGDEPVDYARMIEFFIEAAQAGQPDAQYQLGYSYENGIGVPINVGKAKYWYEKAAEQGNSKARRRGKALEGLK